MSRAGNFSIFQKVANWGPPSSGLFVPIADYGNRTTTALLVIQQGINPTSDYYVRPRLNALKGIPAIFADIRSAPPEEPPSDGTFVVIVRYLSGAWGRYLSRHRNRFSGVAYLMDDDLAVTCRTADLPLRYRWKIFYFFTLQRHTLAMLCDQIWVSNSYLAEKYKSSNATIISPLPLIEHPSLSSTVIYFYYGSASHRREHEWLVDVVREVQSETDNLIFVTIGDKAVKKIYSGIPRVLILHPLIWPTYAAVLPKLQHDIGLAPLLDGPFNRSRTHTKYFDFTRFGAVGIYASKPPYADFVRNNVDGVLVDFDKIAWRDAILCLAQSGERRLRLLEAAKGRIAELASRPEPFEQLSVAGGFT